MDLRERIFNLTKRLVLVASETCTVEECVMSQTLYEVLVEMPYFAEHPKLYGNYLIEEDPLQRSIVWGLVRGNGSKTVVLINHLDTVDTRDFLELRPIAGRPEELADELAKKDLDADVMADLKSGDWLFGRGTADMKGGAALQLALLEQYSLEENFEGNVLFLSVPDEETLSAGMRAAVNLLGLLQQEYQLEFGLLIDVETHVRHKPDSPVLYKGSIGKLMPAVYVRGVRAHIGNVFQGFNPIAVLSEIVNLVELNGDFSDHYAGEFAPPPTWMYLRDNKKTYDVSSPYSAFGYTSILTYTSTPATILEKMKEMASQAFNVCLTRYRNAYLRYYGRDPQNDWHSEVYTFDELFNELSASKGVDFQQAWDSQLAVVSKAVRANEYNMTVGTELLMEFLANQLPHSRPVVIIGLEPPYYPHVINDNLQQADETIHNLGVTLQKRYRQKYQKELTIQNFYTAISDMSYASLQDAEEVIPALISNMPLWGEAYQIPLKKIANLQIPSINLGPWGKDLHMFSERIYLPDLLECTPWLMDQAIRLVLN